MESELSLFDSTSQELFNLSPPYDGSELDLDMPYMSDVDNLESCGSPASTDADGCGSSFGDEDLVAYLGGNKGMKITLKPDVKDQDSSNVSTDMVLRNRSSNTPNNFKKFGGNIQMTQVLINSKDLHDTQKRGVFVDKAKDHNKKYIVRCDNSRLSLLDTRVSIAESEASSLSKNAIAARENRQKKKQYVSGLEKNVQELSTENSVLRSKNKSINTEVENLRMEVQYLKSVIANQSTLAALLKNIGTTPGIQFLKSQSVEEGDYVSEDDDDSHETLVTSSKTRKRSACGSSTNVNSGKRMKVEHDYATRNCTKSSLQPARRPPVKTIAKPSEEDKSRNEADCGVCLHVSKNIVSLEFCASCNQKATHVKH